jgi:hypothetical protein
VDSATDEDLIKLFGIRPCEFAFYKHEAAIGLEVSFLTEVEE